METIVDKIPVSLYEALSGRLVNIILDSDRKDAVPKELAKKIIYLWRQDQLATPAGVGIMLDAARISDAEKTSEILDELGLQEITVSIKAL
jgi:hypothetical protein